MGIRTKKNDLMGESQIILQMSSSLTGSKALKAGGEKVGASVTQP